MQLQVNSLQEEARQIRTTAAQHENTHRHALELQRTSAEDACARLEAARLETDLLQMRNQANVYVYAAPHHSHQEAVYGLTSQSAILSDSSDSSEAWLRRRISETRSLWMSGPPWTIPTARLQTVANTLWAFATLGTKPGERLMGQLEGRAEVISGEFNS
jgi:hypothetical protein